MIRQVKVFAISMVFTTVAMGFAYALPSALRDSAVQVPDALEALDEEAEVVEAPEQPEVEDSSEGEPEDEQTQGQDEASEGESNFSKDDNHGAVVRVAAHCSVRGRAHGELVRSVARDKDMTVSEAEAACEAALAEQEEQVRASKPDKPGRPENPGRSGEAPGQLEHDKPATPSNSSKPDKPGKPDSPGKSGGSGKPH